MRAAKMNRSIILRFSDDLRDYWNAHGESPAISKADFESRFRMPRAVFMRIYNKIKDEPLFGQRVRRQSH